MSDEHEPTAPEPAAAEPRGRTDQVLTDNFVCYDPTGVKARFEKGTRFSALPDYAQDRVRGNPVLLKKVRVKMVPVTEEVD
jgi:hypothetical protein